MTMAGNNNPFDINASTVNLSSPVFQFSQNNNPFAAIKDDRSQSGINGFFGSSTSNSPVNYNGMLTYPFPQTCSFSSLPERVRTGRESSVNSLFSSNKFISKSTSFDSKDTSVISFKVPDVGSDTITIDGVTFITCLIDDRVAVQVVKELESLDEENCQRKFASINSAETNFSLFGENKQSAKFGFDMDSSDGIKNLTESAFGAPKSTFGGFGSTNSFGQNQQSTSIFNTSSGASTGLFGANTGSFFTAFGGPGRIGTTIKFDPVGGADTLIKNGVNSEINVRHQCITVMSEYEGKSLEEWRLEDYTNKYGFGLSKLNSSKNKTLKFGTDNERKTKTSKSTIIKFNLNPTNGEKTLILNGINYNIKINHRHITIKTAKMKEFESVEMRMDCYETNRILIRKQDTSICNRSNYVLRRARRLK